MSKGKKIGYASKIANFMDGIIYDKGVIACTQNKKDEWKVCGIIR